MRPRNEDLLLVVLFPTPPLPPPIISLFLPSIAQIDSPYDYPPDDSIFDDDDSHTSDAGVHAMPKQGSALPAVRKRFSYGVSCLLESGVLVPFQYS